MDNSSEIVANCVYRFNEDTTKRLSFRKSDLLVQVRFTSFFSKQLSIVDLWEMKSGQYATITNRIEDLPSWFRFHPTEVCNRLAFIMLDRFNKGDYPPAPMDASNIWRIRAGDRVIWLGGERPDIKSEQGIINIFTFSECALLYGEPMSDYIDQFLNFGALVENAKNEEKILQTRNAIEIVKAMGIPRSFSSDWKFG